MVSVVRGFSSEIRLPKLPARTSQVSITLDGGLTFGGTASDGGARACPINYALGPATGYSSIVYAFNDTTWEWNYNKTSGTYGNSAFQDDSEVDGVWSNSSYHVKSVPVPFPLTGRTSYTSEEGNGVDWVCYSEGSVDVEVSADLLDARTGATIPLDNSTPAPFYDAVVSIDRTTDYGWYSGSSWNGSSKNYTVYPVTWSRDNQSTASVSETYSNSGYSVARSPGANSAVLNSSFSFNGTRLDFSGPFGSSHPWELELVFYVYGYAYDIWPQGRASFSASSQPWGGVDLASIAYA